MGCRDGLKFTVLEVTLVNGSLKFKVEFIDGGEATFGKRELLRMMTVHLTQQLAEPQMQQPAESAVKVRSICEHGRQRKAVR